MDNSSDKLMGLHTRPENGFQEGNFKREPESVSTTKQCRKDQLY